ncbi:MAG: HEAT repeat domain-containing protein [Gemmataceae bacterium]|nr:HEAT repeat domain-containing protein [Gemmataceae bacterium]
MKRWLYLTIVVCLWCPPARAYVDSSPTLGQLLRDSRNVVLLEVAQVNQEKRVIVWKKVADLHGRHADAEMRHALGDGSHPREPRTILDWARPGRRAVFLYTGKVGQVCIGQYWYQCSARQENWWSMTRGLPEFALAYFGPVDKLAAAVTDIMAGKEAVVTAVANRAANGFSAHGAVALRSVLRGKQYPIWRVKSSLKMPASAYELAGSPLIVGNGAGGADDVPALLQRLQDADVRVRQEAAELLGLIGPPAHKAVAALDKSLGDADPQVRVQAAEALARISAGHKQALTTLAALVQHEDPTVRRAAVESLGNLGPEAAAAAGKLAVALTDAEAAVRWTAAETLGRIGVEAKSAVPALVAALKDRAVRGSAADALGSIGGDAKSAIPALCVLAKDPDKGLRRTAAVALARIGGEGVKPALPVLLEMLHFGDEREFWDAMQQFALLGAAAKEALPEVRKIFEARRDFYAAYLLLGVAGAEAVEAVPIFLPILESGSTDMVWLLGQIPAAAPELIALVRNPKAPNRHLAIKTLALIGGKHKAAMPALNGALKDGNATVRREAAAALGSIEPRPKESVPVLTAALGDSDVHVRLAAAWSLLAIQAEEAKTIVSPLADLLQQEDVLVRRGAAHALGSLGPPAKGAAARLRAALRDADAGVRVAAAWALATTGATQPKTALPYLLQGLKVNDGWTRRHSAAFLGALGPAAQDAAAALAELLHDENEEVREASAAALKQIRAVAYDP